MVPCLVDRRFLPRRAAHGGGRGGGAVGEEGRAMLTVVIEVRKGIVERVRANDDDLQIVLHDKDLADQGQGPGIAFYPCGILSESAEDRYIKAALK